MLNIFLTACQSHIVAVEHAVSPPAESSSRLSALLSLVNLVPIPLILVRCFQSFCSGAPISVAEFISRSGNIAHVTGHAPGLVLNLRRHRLFVAFEQYVSLRHLGWDGGIAHQVLHRLRACHASLDAKANPGELIGSPDVPGVARDVPRGLGVERDAVLLIKRQPILLLLLLFLLRWCGGAKMCACVRVFVCEGGGDGSGTGRRERMRGSLIAN